MSVWVYAAAAALIGAAGWTGFRMFSPGEGVRRWPAPPPEAEEQRTGESGADSLFAGELYAINVDMAAEANKANHVPLHLAEEDPEPVESVEPAVEVVDVIPPAPTVAPWMVPALDNEPTPLFSAPGQHRYPEELQIESFTGSWNRLERSELIERIRQEEARQAGVEAA